MTDHDTTTTPAPQTAGPAVACCEPEQQDSCCEPSQKAACCGGDAQPAACGC